MGWDRVGWARRQTGKHEEATSERTNGILLCQSVSDRFDVDGESAALAFGREISERRCRHAVEEAE